MQQITLKSPAKLNLFLRVTGKYANGYHKIHTLFHRIDLLDTLKLKKAKKGIRIYCEHPQVPTGRNNIMTRAYELLKERFPHLGGVRVELTKRIPVQAGLGGGSGNAAYFIIGMNRLYRLGLNRLERLEIGNQLGADVAFFLHEVRQAEGRGRGDQIQPVLCKGRKFFVLMLLREGLETRKVYQTYKISPKGASLTNKPPIARIPSHFVGSGDLFLAAKGLINDLEVPAFKLCPLVQKTVASAFQLGAPAVAMSGSGTAVFAIAENQRAATELAQRLKKHLKFCDIQICKTY